jgi:hypothetical protein
MNPVRAGACRDAKRWPWSSYPAFIGETAPPSFLTLDWVLAYFGNDRERSARRLAVFVEDVSAQSALVKGSDPRHDRRMKGGHTGPERRSGKDRRKGQERRRKKPDAGGAGGDRRSGRDRRSGEERREDKDG